VYQVEGPVHTSVYRKRSDFARVYSLPYIFRKLRQNRGMTKRAFGAKFGFSEEYVSSIESGSKFPSLRYCLLCADEFDANPNWVKTKWAKECIERFSTRLNRKLGLDQLGGAS